MYVYGKWIIIEDANFTAEDVEMVKQQLAGKDQSKLRVLITRNMALQDSSVFEKICSTFPGINVYIKVDEVEYDPDFNQSQVFTRDEMVQLFKNNNVVESNGAKLYLSAYTFDDDPLDRENIIPFSKVIQSNAKMNNWVDKINKARVNGRPLSPFEKYLYAYQIVTQFKYTDEQIFEARDISRVLSSKFIVCAGYSAILSELCRRVGIVCKRQMIHVHNTGNPRLDAPNVANHEECLFYLKDPKYGIDGFFITDPTLDSLDTYVADGTSITHALINLDEHDKLYKNSEELITLDYYNFSTYFFLRDAKVIPNKKLFYESDNYLDDVANAVDDGLFDSEFKEFISNKVSELNVPKRINGYVSYGGNRYENIMLNDQVYSIEQISKNIGLLTNLAYKYYATANVTVDPNAIVIRQFFEKALSMHIKNAKIEKNEKWINSLAEKFIEIAKKTEAVVGDAQLLTALGDYHDFNIVMEAKTYQKFDEIKNQHAIKSPTIEDYKRAMKNVYLARGDKLEDAKKSANFLVNASIWVADALGWAGTGTQNPFAIEAERTHPVETVQNKQIEAIAPYLEQVGITVEEVKQVIAANDEQAFLKILELVESVMPKKETTNENNNGGSTSSNGGTVKKHNKKYDNRNIRAWAIAPQKPKFWEEVEGEVEQIEVKNNPFID